jgi:hypothetical protein
MKKNILRSIVLLSALALASCSTTNQLASTQKADDDVYFSKAEAGEAPVYRQPVREDRYTDGNAGNGNDDDYYYYDSYSSRINRFGYNSPFDYYDDYYYGYNSPYAYNSFAFSPFGGGFGYGGWNLGIGLGYGYGGYGYGGWGSPFGYGYGLGLGYGYGGIYSPYSYWGTGLGYGGGYWGVYSANNSNYRPRPDRNFNGTGGGRTVGGRVGYNGNYPNTGYYPGRATNSVRGNGSGTTGNTYGGRQSRGARGDANSQPVYRPTTIDRPAPSYNPGNSGGNSGGGGGGRSSGGGGGGARPSRP